MKPASTLAVYCGSSKGQDPEYERATRAVARRCANEGVHIVCGGAQVGLMGELARAATEAGGRVTGVLPRFLAELEPPEPTLTELVLVETMQQRKATMAARADSFLVLPGGLGTLEEISEVLTLRQLGAHAKNAVFLNVAGYWKPLLDMFVAMQDAGFFILDGRRTIELADSLDQAWSLLEPPDAQ